MEITLYYESNKLGQNINWEEGPVNCECRITGHFSNGTNTRIAKSTDILTSYTEQVYISIPAYFLEEDDFVVLTYCTVDCRVSAGIFDLKASDRFEVYFRGDPYLQIPD